MLHNYQLIADFCSTSWQCLKMVPNFFDKENYVLNYKNMQIYLRLGLKLKIYITIYIAILISSIIIQSITMVKTICQV